MTLPATLIDEVQRVVAATSKYRTATEFIKAAIEDGLARVSDSDAPHAPPSAPVLPSGASKAESVRAGGPSRGSGGRPPHRDVEDEGSRVRDPTQSATLPSAATPPAPSTTDAEIRTSHPVTNPDDRTIVREVAKEISMWTCPTCKATIPIEERWDHKKVHAREGPAHSPPPAPPAKTLNLAKVEEHVLEATKGGLPRLLETGTERIYLRALVRRGLEVQGVPDDAMPADDIVDGLLDKLAKKSSVIDRALKVVA